MSYDSSNEGALDYLPCRYGTSKLLFRGPRRDLSEPYIAFFGSTETYGKFVQTPFVDLLDQQLDVNCVNFGCQNAGVDVFLNDPFLPEAAQDAEICVVQVTGAQNMSNRLYTVHPRRNDRFVSATRMLRSIFPDVDFAAFHFTKHMLKHLKHLSPERYRIVETELSEAWCSRMQQFVENIPCEVVLLSTSRAPLSRQNTYEHEPMHVTDDMVEEVIPFVSEYVSVTASGAALSEGLDGMVYAPLEAPAAREMLGAQFHMEVAQKLAPVLSGLLKEQELATGT